jgi:hypothetical protein
MGSFGHREPFRFAEPNENSSFLERSPVIFSIGDDPKIEGFVKIKKLLPSIRRKPESIFFEV